MGYQSKNKIWILVLVPLQNRVDPSGNIITSSGRGTWTGNRGVIHKNRKIIAPYRTKNWITCSLEYKDFRRSVMSENRWTELFFLDEATAFSAGHRPCAFCRNKAFKDFKTKWLVANAKSNNIIDTSIKSVDDIIHQERLKPNGAKNTFTSNLKELPDGVMISIPNQPESFLYHKNHLFLWSPSGYISSYKVESDQLVSVLTPKSIVEVLKAGYKCHIHDSVELLASSNP